jgi:hypothetical protein
VAAHGDAQPKAFHGETTEHEGCPLGRVLEEHNGSNDEEETGGHDK